MSSLIGLDQLEFSRVDFTLEFQEPIAIDLPRQLRLRRDLRAAARQIFDENARNGRVAGPFANLFDPPLPQDPVAQRKFQRPGPSFVLHPDPARCGRFEEGDNWTLAVLFWGKGVQHLSDFARVLQVLGTGGFHHGEGRFEIAAIEGRNCAGEASALWVRGRDLGQLAPPVIPVDWWLDALAPRGERLTLEFITPARLLSQGKPLFRPDFTRLFPFILRRVGSMAYAHCGVEVIAEPRTLQEIAAQVQEVSNDLFWDDWRTLEGHHRDQELGGVSGRIVLTGAALAELEALLRIGSLLHLGKSAAFGAGSYSLS